MIAFVVEKDRRVKKVEVTDPSGKKIPYSVKERGGNLYLYREEKPR